LAGGPVGWLVDCLAVIALLRSVQPPGNGARSAAPPRGAGAAIGFFQSIENFNVTLFTRGNADTLTVSYENALDLMRDLRGMGEANAIAERRKDFTRRSTLLRAAAIYEDMFAQEGRMPATFQILNLTAWAPHESQQKPLRPGSAANRLADAIGKDDSMRSRSIATSGMSAGGIA
jgi:hypothetical protein